MKYVCEPFSNQISDLQAERKSLAEQLGTSTGEQRTSLTTRIAEIDHELPGLQQSLADCLSHPEHFKEDPPDPTDPRKR